jgi:hypothetical protein
MKGLIHLQSHTNSQSLEELSIVFKVCPLVCNTLSFPAIFVIKMFAEASKAGKEKQLAHLWKSNS